MRLIEHKVSLEVGHNLTLIVDVAYDLECMPPMSRKELIEDAVAQALDGGIQTGVEDLIRVDFVCSDGSLSEFKGS
jgi:hypothetical protein